MKQKRKLLTFILTFTIVISLLGCESTKLSDDNEDNNTPVEEGSPAPVDDYDKYNILTIGEIEIDNTKQYDGDQFIYTKVKVTNNSDKTIRGISLDYTGLDKDNNVISNGLGEYEDSIEPKKSYYIEGVMDRNENINTVKIDTYQYYIDNAYYMVDTVNKHIEEVK